MSNLTSVVCIDLLIICCLTIIGLLFVHTLMGKTDRLTWLSLSFGLGAALFSWCMFIISWIGIRLDKLSVVLIVVFLFVSGIGLAWLNRKRSDGQGQVMVVEQSRREKIITGIAWSTILLTIFLAAVLSVGLSYYTWDDIDNWAVKGYGIALEGTIFAGNVWGTNGLSYPLNITLIISLFRIVDGDLVPGSKLIFPLFYLSLLLVGYRFLVRYQVKVWLASLGMLFLISSPILFQHATTGYANIPFAFYILAGLTLGIEGLDRGHLATKLLSGTLFACALWTRPDGVILVIACLLGIGAALFLMKKRINLLALIAPVLVIGIPWIVFMRIYSTSYGEAYQLFSQAIKGILVGQFHPEAFLTIFRFIAGQTIRYREWGAVPFMLILILLPLRWRMIKNDLANTILILVSVFMGAALIALHYLGAFSPEGTDFLYRWLSLEFTRLVMPIIPCILILGIRSLDLALRDNVSCSGVKAS